jgi:hypothetical protein
MPALGVLTTLAAEIVIPAKAGIHVATVKVKMDPRFRGDDEMSAGCA